MEKVTLPRYIQGVGAVAQVGEVCRPLGHTAMVIGGVTAMSVALESIKASLAQAGVELLGAEAYGGECNYENVERMAKIAGEKNADIIIGVGGGKALDTAKGCAHLVNKPVITVPTIAATCAAVSALSVMYNEDGKCLGSMFHEQPPTCAVIDMDIIAHAPSKYLRAGMGDTIAKHVECVFAARGRELSHSCTLAVNISRGCYEPLLTYGVQAMREVETQKAGEALTQVVLAIIVTTGMVSILIEEHYNGALAHAIFYGMANIPGFEKSCLHGDAVGYGVLVQQIMDGKTDSFRDLYALYRQIGMPCTMRETSMELTDELLDKAAPMIIQELYSVRLLPYEVTVDMLKKAMRTVEDWKE